MAPRRAATATEAAAWRFAAAFGRTWRLHAKGAPLSLQYQLAQTLLACKKHLMPAVCQNTQDGQQLVDFLAALAGGRPRSTLKPTAKEAGWPSPLARSFIPGAPCHGDNAAHSVQSSSRGEDPPTPAGPRREQQPEDDHRDHGALPVLPLLEEALNSDVCQDTKESPRVSSPAGGSNAAQSGRSPFCAPAAGAVHSAPRPASDLKLTQHPDAGTCAPTAQDSYVNKEGAPL